MARLKRRERGRHRTGRPQDRFGRDAKNAGYPARSVFKLQEIDQRLRLLKPGQRVIDLGASPGSWALYAAERVGRQGIVLAYDLHGPKTALPEHVSWHKADVLTLGLIEGLLPGGFDVVLSDMAPATSGHRHLDQYRSHELFMNALRIADHALRPGGSFVGKIFQGPDFEEARSGVRAVFAEARVVRPKATRSESYEVFIAGLDRKAIAEPDGSVGRTGPADGPAGGTENGTPR